MDWWKAGGWRRRPPSSASAGPYGRSHDHICWSCGRPALTTELISTLVAAPNPSLATSVGTNGGTNTHTTHTPVPGEQTSTSKNLVARPLGVRKVARCDAATVSAPTMACHCGTSKGRYQVRGLGPVYPGTDGRGRVLTTRVLHGDHCGEKVGSFRGIQPFK